MSFEKKPRHLANFSLAKEHGYLKKKVQFTFPPPPPTARVPLRPVRAHSAIAGPAGGAGEPVDDRRRRRGPAVALQPGPASPPPAAARRPRSRPPPGGMPPARGSLDIESALCSLRKPRALLRSPRGHEASLPGGAFLLSSRPGASSKGPRGRSRSPPDPEGCSRGCGVFFNPPVALL